MDISFLPQEEWLRARNELLRIVTNDRHIRGNPRAIANADRIVCRVDQIAGSVDKNISFEWCYRIDLIKKLIWCRPEIESYPNCYLAMGARNSRRECGGALNATQTPQDRKSFHPWSRCALVKYARRNSESVCRLINQMKTDHERKREIVIPHFVEWSQISEVSSLTRDHSVWE